MKSSEIRIGTTAALASAILLGGCMFLLDTEKLEEGSGGASGSAGLGGDGGDGAVPEAGGDAIESGGSGGSQTDAEADPPCTDDLSCLDDDPCTVDTCELSSATCAHQPHHGIGLTVVNMFGADSEHVATIQSGVDSIGMPVLSTDGDSFWLGYWYEDGGSRDVAIKHFQAEETVAPTEVRLKGNNFMLDDVFSSPAMLVRDFAVGGDGGVANRRLAVVIAGSNQGAGPGIHVRVLDPDTLGPTTASLFPMTLAGYVDPNGFADPVTTAPGILLVDDHIIVTWVKDRELHTWDKRMLGSSNANAHTHDLPGDVLNALPIQGTNLTGNADFGAVLELANGSSYSTSLWSHGNDTTLVNLDSSGGARLGIAAAPLTDPVAANPSALSVAAWAYDTSNGPRITAAGALCGAGQCIAATFPGEGESTGEGMYPAAASTWLSAYPDVRAVAITQVLHSPDDGGYSMILGTVFALEFGADGGLGKTLVNPPYLLVRGPTANPSGKPADSPFQRGAIAMSETGRIMVAWVEAEKNGKKSLRARRYGTKVCP